MGSDNQWMYSFNPFPVNRVLKLNYRCDLSTEDESGVKVRFISNILEDFSIVVWAHRIQKSGFFPPREPYTVQLKSVASRIPHDCNPVSPYQQQTRREVMINDTGHVVTRMGLIPYEYTWPMLCWAGWTYEY